MKKIYVTEDGKQFNSELECMQYEAKPFVYCLRLIHQDHECYIGDKNILLGVYLTRESAEIAQENFLTDKRNVDSYKIGRRYNSWELSIRKVGVESNYTGKNEPLPLSMWKKFKSIFK